ncbi:unnamed protein product [Toxocara canis]|uniref:ZC3H14 n=1 Tax=Toxocara canis TaxID=6265 RepID=A0A183UNJ1_TOXCA|nr:unnamed protein product [Toxocara canis]
MRRRRRSTDTNGMSASPGTPPGPRVSFDKSAASGPPPTTSNRLAGLSDLDFQKALQASLRQRRTSLPVSSNALLINKPAVCFFKTNFYKWATKKAQRPVLSQRFLYLAVNAI